MCISFIKQWLLDRAFDKASWKVEMPDGKKFILDEIMDEAMAKCECSQYFDKHLWSGFLIDMMMRPTIDDPVLISISKGFKKLSEKNDWSYAYFAEFILAFTQQNITYTLDSTQFGRWNQDVWMFPVNTLVRRKGDCEDMSFVCAGIMHLCGIDCVTVSLPGHVAVAVTGEGIPEGPVMYEYKGLKYTHAETTRRIPLGKFDNTSLGSADFIACITYPDDYFMERIKPGII